LIINSFRACGITTNTDLTDIVLSMACFKDDGQLAAHREPFLTALNAASDRDNDEIEVRLMVRTPNHIHAHTFSGD
jgi:hypothetical protein